MYNLNRCRYLYLHLFSKQRLSTMTTMLMTNTPEESIDITPQRKVSEWNTGETPNAASQTEEVLKTDGLPEVESTDTDTSGTLKLEIHSPTRIKFDADNPSASVVEVHRPPALPASERELELAAKLGISAEAITDYGSAPTTPTSSRQLTFRPILKSDQHHSHHHHMNGSAPQPDFVVTPSDHPEPKRRVSIVVEDQVSVGPTKKISTSSYDGRLSLRSIGLDSMSIGQTRNSSSSDGRSTKPTLHDGGSGPPTPQLANKRSVLATIPISTISGKHELENGKGLTSQDESTKTKPTSSSKIHSAWYLFCQRCRKEPDEDSEEPWEPPHWQVVCPYPFCPTYRQFARVTGITLVVLLLWGCTYAVVGEDAGPGGQLFALALLTIAAHFGGWLVSLATLPALIGMLLVGILFQNVGLFFVKHEYSELMSVLRKVALVIILTRAGLDLDPSAMRKLFLTMLKLGLVPWTVECVVIAVTSHIIFDMPWMWGFLIGSVVAAVSPAVVVPCLIRLRSKGYGVAKGIPTLIIAVSGIDDAASVAVFGIIQSIMFSNDSLAYQIAQGPLSIIVGIGFGILWGILAKYVPEKNDPFVVPLRVLMLFGAGLISVLGSETIGLGGAGPLAVVAAAFVSCYSWTQQGWEVEENPVATAFEIFWMIFEPILFGLTGTQIKFNELNPNTVSLLVGCLFIGIVLRILCTILIAFKNKLNLKEKVFISFAFMSKASVQAALGPVVLDLVQNSDHNTPDDERNAHLVLLFCIVSILMTAPLSAVLLTFLGPRLLTKTTIDPVYPENWRRHTRPSLRDITIVDEEDQVGANDDTLESGTTTPTSSIRGSGRRRHRGARSIPVLSAPTINTIS